MKRKFKNRKQDEFKRKRKKNLGLGLKGWMILESLIIVIGSIMAYELIDFFVNYVINRDDNYDGLSALGMLIPMGLIVYLITSAFSKTLYRQMNELINGINQIADGDYQLHLNEKGAGPLKKVYQNFNKMVGELNSIETIRNDFVNEFSHEIKTPLASINGFSNLLLDGHTTPEQTTQYLQIIATESERLVTLTQNQLLLSKLNSQQIVIDKNVYSIDEQVRKCMILLAPQWEKKKIDISVDLPKIYYCGNEDMMQHVWINLLNNAIKYTPEAGSITITASEQYGYHKITIADSGIGMTDQELEHIFQKYYRVTNSTSVSGLGLGLSIAKRVLDLNNAHLEVTSSPGKGSCFTVALPL